MGVEELKFPIRTQYRDLDVASAEGSHTTARHKEPGSRSTRFSRSPLYQPLVQQEPRSGAFLFTFRLVAASSCSLPTWPGLRTPHIELFRRCMCRRFCGTSVEGTRVGHHTHLCRVIHLFFSLQIETPCVFHS